MADTDKSTETKVGSWNLPTPSRVVAAPGLDHASLPEEIKRRIAPAQSAVNEDVARAAGVAQAIGVSHGPIVHGPQIEIDPGDCGAVGKPAEFVLRQADPQNPTQMIEVGRLVVEGKYPNTTEHWFLYTSVSKSGYGAYKVPGAGNVTTDIEFALNSCLPWGFDAVSYTTTLTNAGNHGTYIVATCTAKSTY